ncbi:unnamed protein product [Prorocentrum cordatum]|uniref:Uncharacterized protein n=1 Tax=Prorocentrum cordatum TaxID=2364126 RepID=A0ABN9QF99_9DINO|nr:unnamed protein product [Polarella glacialis]
MPGSHGAAPQWTIPSAERGRPPRTGADAIDPGAYKVERDFPTSADELRKGKLTSSRSSPSFTFSGEDRTDGRGKLKGMNFPLGRWHSDAGPGQYDLEMTWPARQRAKQPHYSVPKAARATQAAPRGPGPGEYCLPSQFGNAGARSLEPLEVAARSQRREARRSASGRRSFTPSSRASTLPPGVAHR